MLISLVKGVADQIQNPSRTVHDRPCSKNSWSSHRFLPLPSRGECNHDSDAKPTTNWFSPSAPKTSFLSSRPWTKSAPGTRSPRTRNLPPETQDLRPLRRTSVWKEGNGVLRSHKAQNLLVKSVQHEKRRNLPMETYLVREDYFYSPLSKFQCLVFSRTSKIQMSTSS